MTQIPGDQHITYQLQHRKCGKPACSTCREGHGHGPYWYAYWREGSRLRSGYIGKVHPAEQGERVEDQRDQAEQRGHSQKDREDQGNRGNRGKQRGRHDAPVAGFPKKAATAAVR